MKLSSVQGALRTRARLIKDFHRVESYLSNEYQKAILKILKHTNDWMSPHMIWGELLQQGLVQNHDYEIDCLIT